MKSKKELLTEEMNKTIYDIGILSLQSLQLQKEHDRLLAKMEELGQQSQDLGQEELANGTAPFPG